MTGATARVRLFVALMLEPGLQAAVRGWRDAWQWPEGAARVPAEQFHLTLFFIGSVDAHRVQAIGDALRRVPMAPMQLKLDRPEVFRGGIAVVRVEPAPQLLELRARVVDALASVGVVPDAAPFKPHLTLARRASGVRKPLTPLELEWPVDRFALVRSVLPPQVPRTRYEVLAWYPPG